MGKMIQFPKKHLFDASLAKSRNMIGKKIGKARKNAGLTQAEFANKLQDYGVNVKTPAVNKWEGGDNVPNAYQLLAICHLLGIKGGLDYFTGYVESNETMLNDEGRRLLRRYAEYLLSDGRYTRKRPSVKDEEVEKKDVNHFGLASAGLGELLGEDQYEVVSYPASMVPEETDFAVTVAGDSMEPRYHDGQVIFIKQTNTLENGQVGLFGYDGDGYVKVYREVMPNEDEIEDYLDEWDCVRPKIFLVSYNKAKYEPIEVKNPESFIIFGRVLN
ncbi:MAG: helix-turn-helix transcriptional regulator [Oscillospiraceae bacterium]|nr:helix-turn-helix transcriptional regulator [Oscillospiraceae bacterium]